MTAMRKLFVCAFLTLCMVGISPARIGGAGDAPNAIKWPSVDYPTLQSAVDAIAPGGKITIAAGEYEITDTIVISRDITLKGEGQGRKSKRRYTRLVGPATRPATDEEGNLILLADDVSGMFHTTARQFTIRNIAMSGFDAAIVVEDDPAAPYSSAATVTNCAISETGRGILSRSSGLLYVKDSEIRDTGWNAISVAPRLSSDVLGHGFNLITQSTSMVNPAGAGIYLSGGFASINEVLIQSAQAGGIVGFEAKVMITNSFLFNNRQSGILMLDSDEFPFLVNIIQGNAIQGSVPLNGLYGDGITLANSGSDLIRNNVSNNTRAGLSNLGSLVRARDNQFVCSGAFDVQADQFNGENFTFIPLGMNTCGCGGTYGSCNNIEAPIAPPMQTGGLE